MNLSFTAVRWFSRVAYAASFTMKLTFLCSTQDKAISGPKSQFAAGINLPSKVCPKVKM